MRWLLSALVLSALCGASACEFEENPFGANPPGGGASGAAGRGTGQGAGEGGGGDSGEVTADSLSIPDNVRIWANSASAVGVYLTVYSLLAIADGEETADASCPVTSDDGTTLTMTGGCTDGRGAEWVGSASVERSGVRDRLVTLDDFGTITNDLADVMRGRAERRWVEADSHEFEVNIVHEAGVTVTIDYAGQVRGDYGERSVWSGSGTITREGSEQPIGTVEVTTTDEVLDDTCGEPASGNTVIDNGRDSVTITYDGSVDCDAENAASYSLNGVAQGNVTGIVCSVSRASGPESALTVLLVLLVGAGHQLRRARSFASGGRSARRRA